MGNSTSKLSPNQSRAIEWSSVASFLIGDIFDEVGRRFSEVSFPDRREGITMWQLQASCHASSESVLLLVANLRLWDADILVRSVVEGSLKFAFLFLGDEVERKTKLDEYEHVLFEIAELKRNARIEEILKVIPDPTADEWRSFRDMVLSPERVTELRSKYPKDLRRQVEQRWSFGEICSSLKRTAPPGLAGLGHMMYSYGTSSHIAHQDSVGIKIVSDRNGRSDERRTAVELAHAARLISDVCTMSWIRADALFRRCNLDTAVLRDFWQRFVELSTKGQEAGANFHSVEYGD